jgi:hypothetical protein
MPCTDRPENLLKFLASRVFYPEDGGYKILRNVGSHKTTLRHIPENVILRSHRRENLKSYIIYFIQLFE